MDEDNEEPAEIYLKTKAMFEDRSKALKSDVPPISGERKEFLHFKYGYPLTLPVDEKIEEPLSPNSSIKKAANYVFHLQDRGFVDLGGIPRDDPLSVYKNSIRSAAARPKKALVKEDQDLEDKGYMNEPEYQELVTMNIVVESIKLIEQLPFIYTNDIIIWVDKFNSKVGTIARSHILAGEFTYRKRTRKQLLDSTKKFYNEVIEIRKMIIKNVFDLKLVHFNKISRKLEEAIGVKVPRPVKVEKPIEKSAFVQLKEVKTRQFDNEILQKVYEGTSSPVTSLPPSYRPSSAFLDDSYFAKFAQTLHNSVTEARRQLDSVAFDRTPASTPARPKTQQTTPIKKLEIPQKKKIMILGNKTTRKKQEAPPKPVPKPNKQELSSLHRNFWEMDDPLASREGKFTEPFEQFKKITDLDSVEFLTSQNNSSHDPLPFIALNLEPQPKNVRKPTREEMVFNQSTPPNEPIVLVEPKLEDIKVKQNYEVAGQNKDAMVYLLSLPPDKGESKVHARLEQIWDSIGFGIIDKLDMVLKYSHDLEESGKLSESLDLWEEALRTIEVYNRAYSSLKDFLKLGDTAGGGIHRQTILEDLRKDLNNSIDGVRYIARMLRETTGDELVIRRRKAEDLIALRNQKLAMLMHTTQ
ncbi:hypothetical protein TVAG_314860 [Trichomonas vaginalis G3]|uniref:Uncharacterized protein n=1 Tax=Trichomonas vaginalis (strain ATCC PRA-98 / G3) TaxID=412133 RepID=A2ETS5_TRIV3|nr:coiled-coil domain-containing protein 87 family [Trichomonas vaginalis G3]EAY03956.1 hypothetical protein TVAG_314860 [Trichomonas vaginalis G3]KAI5541025.1 coiled-coil domain-containing protein 87 family [Trichomonas vaginalis G3]|eukprot:XP_001316179.1 hypothetical protein [Trichomonas vaginalis G3]